jgi:hypothetical protein
MILYLKKKPMPVNKGTIMQEMAAMKALMRRLPTQAANEAKNFFLGGWQLQGWQGDNGLVPWVRRDSVIKCFRRGPFFIIHYFRRHEGGDTRFGAPAPGRPGSI